MLQRFHSHAWCTRWFPFPLAKLIFRAGFVFQAERDFPIWSNKIYRDKPMLVREEANVRAYRRWFQQFFTDASLSFPDALDVHARAMACASIPEW